MSGGDGQRRSQCPLELLLCPGLSLLCFCAARSPELRVAPEMGWAPGSPFLVSRSYFLLCAEAGVGRVVILLYAHRRAAFVSSPELQGAGPWPGDSLASSTCLWAGGGSRGPSDPRRFQSRSACQAVSRPVSSPLEGGSPNSLICFRWRDYPANLYVSHSGLK